MIFFVRVAIFFMRLIYCFMKLFKTKNRIIFLSRQSDNLTLDYRLLKKEIEENSNVEIIFISKLVNKNLKSVLKSMLIMLKEMYYLATSKVCVTDGYNIVISNLKHKKELKIIQIWHSLGAIKKFGYQTLYTKKQKKLAKLLNMHKNYDYIISTSNEMTKYFSKAFGYPLDKFYNIGLPRIDYILNNTELNKELIYEKYPEFKNKKIILYVPTFRENSNYKVNELIDSIDLKKYILIIKMHPIIKYNVNSEKKVYTCNNFSSLQLLSISDYVITDYSAISIEASILNKKVYLYVYDYDEYSKIPGINIDLYKDLKYVFKDEKKLFKAIEKNDYNLEIIRNYKNKYVTNSNGTVTKQLVDFILEKVN